MVSEFCRLQAQEHGVNRIGVSEASFGQLLLTVSAVCVLISSYQATPPAGLGPTPMTSFCLNYNFRGSAL